MRCFAAISLAMEARTSLRRSVSHHSATIVAPAVMAIVGMFSSTRHVFTGIASVPSSGLKPHSLAMSNGAMKRTFVPPTSNSP